MNKIDSVVGDDSRLSATHSTIPAPGPEAKARYDY
jgi:hypothetical protein